MSSNFQLKSENENNNEITDATTLFKTDLLQCIQDGVTHYKILMSSLLAFKYPFKDSQLRSYHDTNLEILKKALETSYADACRKQDEDANKEMQKLLNQGKKTLEAFVNAEFKEIFLRKQENFLDSVGKKVKEIAAQAEIFYDKKVKPELKGKSRDKVQIAHSHWKEETIKYFHRLLLSHGFEIYDFYSYELKQKLSDQLESFLEDCPEDSFEASYTEDEGSNEDIHEWEANILQLLERSKASPSDIFESEINALNNTNIHNSETAVITDSKEAEIPVLESTQIPISKISVANTTNIPGLEIPASKTKEIAVSEIPDLAKTEIPAPANPDLKTTDILVSEITKIPTLESARIPIPRNSFTETEVSEAKEMLSLKSTEIPFSENPVTEIPVSENSGTEIPFSKIAEIPVSRTAEIPVTQIPVSKPAKIPDTEIPASKTAEIPITAIPVSNITGIQVSKVQSSETLENQETSMIPITPKILENMEAPEILKVQQVSKLVENPQFPTISNRTEFPKFAKVTEIPKDSEISQAHKVADIPELQDTQKVSNKQAISETPKIPVHPVIPVQKQEEKLANKLIHDNEYQSLKNELKLQNAAISKSISVKRLVQRFQSPPKDLDLPVSKTSSPSRYKLPEKLQIPTDLEFAKSLAAEPLNPLSETTATAVATTTTSSARTTIGNQTKPTSTVATTIGNKTKPTSTVATTIGNQTKPTSTVATTIGNQTKPTSTVATTIPDVTTLSASTVATTIGNQTKPTSTVVTTIPDVTTLSAPTTNTEPNATTALTNPKRSETPTLPYRSHRVLDNTPTRVQSPTFPPSPSPLPFRVASPKPLPSEGKIITYTVRRSTSQSPQPTPTSPKLMTNPTPVNPVKPLQKRESHFEDDVFTRDKSEDKEITSSSFRTKKNILPKSELQLLQTGIGIYFDENVFKIGIFLESKFKEVLSLSPVIYFSNAGILVGEDARPHQRKRNGKYFNIFQLISSFKPVSLPPIQFVLKDKKQIFCIHEIIALFFHKVISTFQQANNYNIISIIFTLPFTPSSAAKERIQRASKIAGFTNIRIFSTLLTTAIGFLDDSTYYQNNKEEKRDPFYVFVLDYHKTSFSVGIVEISPTSIIPINPYGSDNMMECQEELFIKSHEEMFLGRKTLSHGERRVRQVYEKGINRVFDNIKDLSIDYIVVGENDNLNWIEKMVVEILVNKLEIERSTLIVRNPLLGASLLASSKAESCSILPREVKVHDTSRSDLVYTKVRNRKIEKRINFMRTTFSQDMVFSSRFNIVLEDDEPQTILIELGEYFGHIANIEACRYELTIQNRQDGKELNEGEMNRVNICIICLMNDDGVFSLEATHFSVIPVEIQMLRVDTFTCDSNCENPGSLGLEKYE